MPNPQTKSITLRRLTQATPCIYIMVFQFSDQSLRNIENRQVSRKDKCASPCEGPFCPAQRTCCDLSGSWQVNPAIEVGWSGLKWPVWVCQINNILTLCLLSQTIMLYNAILQYMFPCYHTCRHKYCNIDRCVSRTSRLKVAEAETSIMALPMS